MDGARKKNILLIHLGTQYAKTDCRNEIYTKNWVRRTWPGEKSTGRSTVKVNGQCSVNAGQRWSTVNGQLSMVNGQRSTTGDDVSRSVDADAARADVAARGGLTWQRVEA